MSKSIETKFIIEQIITFKVERNIHYGYKFIRTPEVIVNRKIREIFELNKYCCQNFSQNIELVENARSKLEVDIDSGRQK